MKQTCSLHRNVLRIVHDIFIFQQIPTTKRKKDEATVSGFRLEDQRWITGVVDEKERGCRWFRKLAVRIVDVSSGKREAGIKGSKVSGSQGEMTEQKSPPVDTGLSSLSDECANSAIAELERLEDFFCFSRVPPSDHGMVARYLKLSPPPPPLPGGTSKGELLRGVQEAIAGHIRPGGVNRVADRAQRLDAEPACQNVTLWRVSPGNNLKGGVSGDPAAGTDNPYRSSEAAREDQTDPVNRCLHTRGEQAFPEAGKAGADGCTTCRKKRRLL
ncbi:hypothetical protein T08_14575 [Trichinella sp. T8]|nr:hypothetical protein T08_14575 [Trichinella sp. T8]